MLVIHVYILKYIQVHQNFQYMPVVYYTAAGREEYKYMFMNGQIGHACMDLLMRRTDMTDGHEFCRPEKNQIMMFRESRESFAV